jgi:hypothetical protein
MKEFRPFCLSATDVVVNPSNPSAKSSIHRFTFASSPVLGTSGRGAGCCGAGCCGFGCCGVGCCGVGCCGVGCCGFGFCGLGFCGLGSGGALQVQQSVHFPHSEQGFLLLQLKHIVHLSPEHLSSSKQLQQSQQSEHFPHTGQGVLSISQLKHVSQLSPEHLSSAKQ